MPRTQIKYSIMCVLKCHYTLIFDTTKKHIFDGLNATKKNYSKLPQNKKRNVDIPDFFMRNHHKNLSLISYSEILFWLNKEKLFYKIY
jgi:hypothetical protein